LSEFVTCQRLSESLKPLTGISTPIRLKRYTEI